MSLSNAAHFLQVIPLFPRSLFEFVVGMGSADKLTICSIEQDSNMTLFSCHAQQMVLIKEFKG
jgi:hypothetical protein